MEAAEAAETAEAVEADRIIPLGEFATATWGSQASAEAVAVLLKSWQTQVRAAVCHALHHMGEDTEP